MKKRILSAVLACAATMAFATTASALPAGSTDLAGGIKPPSTTTTTPSDSGSTGNNSNGNTTNKPGTSTPTKVEKKIEVEVALSDDGKLEGEALTKQVLSKDGETYKWNEVKTVTFKADGVFKLSFYADQSKFDKELFVVGVDKLPSARDDAEEGFATEQSLTAEHVALFDPAKGENAVVIEAKDASTKITAEVTVEVDAPAEGGDNTVNPGTGIALAVAPAGLAVAFVAVAAVMNKKKRG